MAGSRDSRWPAEYAATFSSPAAASLTFLRGEILLRQDVARLVLFDAGGLVIDARCLLAGEVVAEGSGVEFPAHVAKIRGAPATPSTDAHACSAAIAHSIAHRVPPVPGGRGTPRIHGGPVGPGASPTSPPATATGHHGAEVSTGEIPRVSFDLPSILSHLWSRPRVSASPPSPDSFGWWPGKIGGDPRSFARVVSPSRGPPPSAGFSSTAMGDRGGRYNAGGGGGGGGHQGGGGGGGAGGR
jgi:hypothetical protein